MHTESKSFQEWPEGLETTPAKTFCPMASSIRGVIDPGVGCRKNNVFIGWIDNKSVDISEGHGVS